MRVIGTVGLPGSGKGEAAAVAEELGVPVVTMGDVVREACRDRGLDPAEHHGEMAVTLREEEGEDAIARRTLPELRGALADHDAVVVDGIRSEAEVERFRDAFGEEFALVSIEAPFEVRAARAAERGRDRSDEDDRRLAERDAREKELGVDDVMARADVTVDNAGSLESFREKIRVLLVDGVDALGARQSG